jgi:hypothetical protein
MIRDLPDQALRPTLAPRAVPLQGRADAIIAGCRNPMRQYLFTIAGVCLVLAFVGCKSVSSYDQLEIEKKKNEERELEREHKSWEINR